MNAFSLLVYGEGKAGYKDTATNAVAPPRPDEIHLPDFSCPILLHPFCTQPPHGLRQTHRILRGRHASASLRPLCRWALSFSATASAGSNTCLAFS